MTEGGHLRDGHMTDEAGHMTNMKEGAGHMTEETSHMTKASADVGHMTGEVDHMTAEAGHMVETIGEKEEQRMKEARHAMKPDSQERLPEHTMLDTSHISISYCLPYLITGRTGLTRYSPASDCEQLLLHNATISSGYYWIDPNLGCSADAVLVYCDFSSNETCLFPTQREEVSYCQIWRANRQNSGYTGRQHLIAGGFQVPIQ